MNESLFLRACKREPVDCMPVWFMRQAGRYLREYRAIRKHHSLIEICRNPDLATEVTLQPLRRFELDAAIIFADILLVLPTMGVEFAFEQGEGPVIERPVREAAQVEDLRVGRPDEELDYVFQAIRQVRTQLSPAQALIGFSGAPFTVASYMIEGRYSRTFLHTKMMMYRQPSAWRELMRKIAETTARYLGRQVEAGAQAIQLFDSWVGTLSPQDYRTYVLPYSKLIFDHLEQYDVPTLHFGTGTATFLEDMVEAGGSVLGLDWRVEISQARGRIGDRVALQGNLDPVALLGPPEVLQEKVDWILDQVGQRPGHIFNLGHGILPPTPTENVKAVVDRVHQKTQVG